jgi:hypothetical protein
MTEIYSNSNLKIVEDIKKTNFRIEQISPDARLVNSLIKTRIIQGGTSTHDYYIIKFKAVSVKTLKQFQEERKYLTINEATKLIADLTTQLKYLITQEKHTILGYSPENIIVINDTKFAFIGSDMFVEIEDDEKNVLVSYPFSINDFFVSPELLKIKEIPSYVHYKTSYFSLACLAIYVLLSDKEFYNIYVNNQNTEVILDSLHRHPIKNTKIYWLLSRCLIEDTEKRSILYI